MENQTRQFPEEKPVQLPQSDAKSIKKGRSLWLLAEDA